MIFAVLLQILYGICHFMTISTFVTFPGTIRGKALLLTNYIKTVILSVLALCSHLFLCCFFPLLPLKLPRVVALSMSPVDDTFISGSLDKTIRLWDLRSPNCQVSHMLAVYALHQSDA